MKQALVSGLSCRPVKDVMFVFSLTSFFFLFLENSCSCEVSAFLLARRSAFSFCAASKRVALISSFIGSSLSSSDSLESSSEEEVSETEPEESSKLPWALCNLY
jgi:hypothetical protein